MQNMPSLPNASTRRFTARAMLFVWLFALVSGIANACLLEPHGGDGHATPLSHLTPEDSVKGVTGPHAEEHTDADGASDTGPANKSCLKACDEGSQSLLKHASSSDLIDPCLAPFVTTVWATQVRVALELHRVTDFWLPDRGPSSSGGACRDRTE